MGLHELCDGQVQGRLILDGLVLVPQIPNIITLRICITNNSKKSDVTCHNQQRYQWDLTDCETARHGGCLILGGPHLVPHPKSVIIYDL